MKIYLLLSLFFFCFFLFCFFLLLLFLSFFVVVVFFVLFFVFVFVSFHFLGLFLIINDSVSQYYENFRKTELRELDENLAPLYLSYPFLHNLLPFFLWKN